MNPQRTRSDTFDGAGSWLAALAAGGLVGYVVYVELTTPEPPAPVRKPRPRVRRVENLADSQKSLNGSTGIPPNPAKSTDTTGRRLDTLA